MTTTRFRTVLAATATGALLLGTGAFAANALDPAEPLQACVNDTNGNMRLVAYGAECRKGESPVTWNAQGPQGIPGPEGPAGELGDLPSGVAYGTEVIRGELELAESPDAVVEYEVTCPDSKILLAHHLSSRFVNEDPDNSYVDYSDFYGTGTVSYYERRSPSSLTVLWRSIAVQYPDEFPDTTTNYLLYELTCAHLTP